MSEDTRTSPTRQSRTTRLVHVWFASTTDGPPLCGTPVRYLGRPILTPIEVCVVCADILHARKDAA
jgi:hypothetical protein